MTRKFRVKKLDKYENPNGATGCKWNGAKSKYVGQIGISNLDEPDRDGDFYIHFADDAWYFHKSWLEEVFDDPQPVEWKVGDRFVYEPQHRELQERRGTQGTITGVGPSLLAIEFDDGWLTSSEKMNCRKIDPQPTIEKPKPQYLAVLDNGNTIMSDDPSSIVDSAKKNSQRVFTVYVVSKIVTYRCEWKDTLEWEAK